MPTYEYRCQKCGHVFERNEHVADHEKSHPQVLQVREFAGGSRYGELLREDVQKELARVSRPYGLAGLRDGAIRTKLLIVLVKENAEWWISAYHNVPVA